MDSGFIFVNKEKGVSSFDVIRQARKKFQIRKMGHSGTLDPFATGLLILAFGGATKLLSLFLGGEKEYEVVAEFGKISDTFDSEGNISETGKLRDISKIELKAMISQHFLGKIQQVPPKFSAIKINGKRAYDLARKGEEFDIKAREVEVEKFEIIDFAWPKVTFFVRVSSGTYIRSLISDLGAKFDVGAYCTELVRTKIKDFSLDDAKKMEDLEVLDFKSVEEVMGDFERVDLTAMQYQNFMRSGLIFDQIVDKNGVVAFYGDKYVGTLELKGRSVLLKKRL